MAGTRFITPSIVGNLALMLLQNTLVGTATFSRRHQAMLVGGEKRGDTVKIRRRQAGTVIRTNPYSQGTNTFQTPPETYVNVTIEHNHKIPISIAPGDFDLDVVSFRDQVLAPQIIALGEDVDQYALSKFFDIPQVGGTGAIAPGALPSSAADIAGIETDLFNLKCPMSGLVHAITGEAYKALISSGTISSAEQRGDGGSALEMARVGRVMNLNHVRTQGIDTATFTSGTMASAVVNGALAAGATTITYDGGDQASGTFKINDIVTIAGYGNVVVAANATASSNAGSFLIKEPLRTAVADNAAITVYDGGGNTRQLHGAAYHEDAFSFVSVPGDQPLGGVESVVVQDGNLGIRVIYGFDMSTSSNQMTLDLYSGCALVDSRLAVQTVKNI
jgi:hypothetical protein